MFDLCAFRSSDDSRWRLSVRRRFSLLAGDSSCLNQQTLTKQNRETQPLAVFHQRASCYLASRLSVKKQLIATRMLSRTLFTSGETGNYWNSDRKWMQHKRCHGFLSSKCRCVLMVQRNHVSGCKAWLLWKSAQWRLSACPCETGGARGLATEGLVGDLL